MPPSSPLPNFAAMKRMPVGTELYCIYNHSGLCRLFRKIVKMQGNGFAYIGDGIKEGTRGWTHWTSAKEYAPTPNGFRLYYVNTPDRYIEYEIISIPTPITS